MQLNNGIIAISMLVSCFGCIEPYNPVIDESDKVLVIDGMITDTKGVQTVTISRSSPYNHPRFQPVSGCVVRVEDESGTGITFLESEDGVYQSNLEPSFLGIGKAYKLLVYTPDGNEYESDYDTLLACAPVDSLSYKLETQGTSNPEINYYGIRFYVDVKGSPEDSRNYLWTFEETWIYLTNHPIQYIWDGFVLQDFTPELNEFKRCYLTSRLENIHVGSTSLLEKNEFRQQPLHFVSNQTARLRIKYSLLVLQHSLSNGAFLYWDRMRAQSGDTGGLFETHPSSTRGNIYNTNDHEEKVLGYFFASQVQEKRINVSNNFDFHVAEFFCPLDTVFTVDDLGSDYPYYMFSISFFGRGPPYVYSSKECHDCRYRGGVTTKPEYWDN